jgi:hypothetical protein
MRSIAASSFSIRASSARTGVAHKKQAAAGASRTPTIVETAPRRCPSAIVLAAAMKGVPNFPNNDYFYGLFHPGEATFAMLTAKGKYSLKALARLAALEGGNVALGARVRPKPQRSTWTAGDRANHLLAIRRRKKARGRARTKSFRRASG